MVQALEPMKANPTGQPLQAAALRQADAERQPQQYQASDQSSPTEPEFEDAGASRRWPRRSATPRLRLHLRLRRQEDDGITVEPYMPAASHACSKRAPRLIDTPIPSAYVPSQCRASGWAAPHAAHRGAPGCCKAVTHGRKKKQETGAAQCARVCSSVWPRMSGLGLKSNEPRADRSAARAERRRRRRAQRYRSRWARNPRVSAGAEGARGNARPAWPPAGRPAAKEQIEIPAFLQETRLKAAGESPDSTGPGAASAPGFLLSR